jgi:hypothetical protein
MFSLNKLVGRIRGLAPGGYAEGQEEQQFHIGSRGDGLVVDGLPLLAEIVRHGDSWQVMSATYTALTAVPTTAAIFSLWNGEPDNGKSYVIDSVAVVKVLADTTQVDKTSAFYQLVKPPVAAIVDGGTVIRSLCGRKSYDGRARTIDGGTTISGRWDPAGTSPYDATALAGTGWQTFDENMRGRYIVPPGGQFSVHRAEVTATSAKFRVTFRWHEVRLPIV